MMGRVFEAASLILMRPIRGSGATAAAAAAQRHDYEMLLVGRPVTAQAFAERVVFPGGKVEASDCSLNTKNSGKKNGFSDRFQVCAIRELFEETGIFLTEPNVQLTDDEYLAWRWRVLTDSHSFNDMIEQLKCKPAIKELTPWSHWITPATGEHRFDTWFFIAQDRDNRKASVYPGEMELTDIDWWTPNQALTAYRKMNIQLAPPQIYILEQLDALRTIDEVFKHAPRPQDIIPYLPIIQRKDNGAFTVLLPGDKHYEGSETVNQGETHRIEVSADPQLTKVYGAINFRSNL